MSFEMIHIIGACSYFICMLLFVWVKQLPKTLPGPGFWALAALCSFISRIIFLMFSNFSDSSISFLFYSAINIIEKPLLMIGFYRVVGKQENSWLIIALTLAAEIWLLMTWLLNINPWAARTVISIIIAVFLFNITFLAIQELKKHSRLTLILIGIGSSLLATHWLLAYPMISHFPSWNQNGFVVGMVITLTMYFGFLGLVLTDVQRRLVQAEKEALDLAYHDPLTGLNNKRYVNNIFDKAVLLANRPHQLIAILYIDLDNFKPINDDAGHQIGDEVLKVVANRLSESTRSTDICARIGGDEFLLLATQLEHEEQVMDVAQKILEQLVQPILIADKQFYLGASIGISLFPKHGQNLTDLSNKADLAMYHVKRHGKSGFEVYNSNMTFDK